MNTTFFIIAWWAFVGILGFSLFAFMRFLSSPKFRNSRGDVSTEVGYTNDSYGAAKLPDQDAAVDTNSTTEEGFSQAVSHQMGPGF
jgi:hypothetical protein